VFGHKPSEFYVFNAFGCECLNKTIRHTVPETGLERKAELRGRSVRVRIFLEGVQEGLLQQALEKPASVKQVELF